MVSRNTPIWYGTAHLLTYNQQERPKGGYQGQPGNKAEEEGTEHSGQERHEDGQEVRKED